MRSSLKTTGRRRGIVLIIVLVLVAMVALAGFGFLADMSTEYEATKIENDRIQSTQVMASAETLMVLLAEQQRQPTSDHFEQRSAFFSEDEKYQGRILQRARKDGEQRPTVSVEAEGDIAVQDNQWRFSILRTLSDRPTQTDLIFAQDVGDEYAEPLQFGMQNESAKLNLWQVREMERAVYGSGYRALMALPGMTTPIADAILDWSDDNDQPRNHGVEKEHYERLKPPIRPRNDIPQSIEELLFVHEVTRKLFYGLTPEQRDSVEEGTPTAWADLLTVHSAERNVDPWGQRRRNLNDGGHDRLQELEQHLSGFVSQELASFIVLARTFGLTHHDPADKVATLSELTPDDVPEPGPHLHHLHSLADLIDARVPLGLAEDFADGRRTIVESPLRSDDLESLRQFEALEERVTTKWEEVLRGGVNINEASEPVLRAVIGDPGITARIIQERETVPEHEQSSVLWLLRRRVMDGHRFRSIYRQITTGGDVYTGHIIVYRRTGGPFRIRKVTVDAANLPARRVNWVDLTEQGLPVSLIDLEQRMERR